MGDHFAGGFEAGGFDDAVAANFEDFASVGDFGAENSEGILSVPCEIFHEGSK